MKNTKIEIQNLITQFLVEQLEYDSSMVSLDAHLIEDLGMTSLDAVETSIYIKRTFGFQPDRGIVKNLITVEDLCNYIWTNQFKEIEGNSIVTSE